jgi:hypothetical protein
MTCELSRPIADSPASGLFFSRNREREMCSGLVITDTQLRHDMCPRSELWQRPRVNDVITVLSSSAMLCKWSSKVTNHWPLWRGLWG